MILYSDVDRPVSGVCRLNCPSTPACVLLENPRGRARLGGDGGRTAFCKDLPNSIRPRLIHANYRRVYREMGATRLPTNVLTYIFCGLFLMLLFYSLANFFQGGIRSL